LLLKASLAILFHDFQQTKFLHFPMDVNPFLKHLKHVPFNKVAEQRQIVAAPTAKKSFPARKQPLPKNSAVVGPHSFCICATT
jgi:hypothetical protein